MLPSTLTHGVHWHACLESSLRNRSKIKSADCFYTAITDVEFADDTLLLEFSWLCFQHKCSLLDQALQLFGACMNKVKTEWMEISGFSNAHDAAPLPGTKILYINGEAIPKTGVFRYLGSLVSIDSTAWVNLDVQRRCTATYFTYSCSFWTTSPYLAQPTDFPSGEA